MADGPGRKRKGNKAQSLLLRFPVTDLARAVSLTGFNRQSFLKQFIDTFTTLSYVPTRQAAAMIYGVQKPLFETPAEPWAAVEKHLKATTDPNLLDMNLEASRHLFDLVRPEGYEATECETQVLRVALKQIVYIGLDFYVTRGQRLIFQFPQPRLDSPTDSALLILGSIIHHAYVQGDYAEADVELADVGRVPGARRTDPRSPRIRLVPREDILSLTALTAHIEDVYGILHELGTRPDRS
ncbi:MAG: hypothetical protein P4L90_23005 [Rhodopila sp.]|nr:hypothetical protein [Rhodopila sp.]